MKKTAVLLLVSVLLLTLLPSVSAAPEIGDAQRAVLARFCAEKAPEGSLLLQMSFAAALLNRMEDPRYPDTFSGNISAAGFSGAAVDPGQYRQSLWAVRCVLSGMDPTGGALRWARKGSVEASRMDVMLEAEGWCFGS